ncbi:adenylyltransferase/cytidyltransferase family protein [Brevundimonas diminuta]|uniref:adenylyltransferase/cytidyltransferase family protein n=1 Tax=Brevundimonas diminuta TaxID=293 RepID=UPI003209E960
MKTIITYGTFDLFHVGHLRLLERARSLGDRLIVAVSTDEFNSIKGKNTVIPYSSRAEIVAGLSCVDVVIPEISWDQKIQDIHKWSVSSFVMGSDWSGKFDHLKNHCDVIYLNRTNGVSTTMIKKFFSSDEVNFSDDGILLSR